MKTPTADAPALMTLSAVAARLSVHEDTVRVWVRKALIAVVVLPSGQKRVSVAELNRILGGRPDDAAAPRETVAERQRRSDRDRAAIKTCK